jgi:hypothetical protein
MSFRCASAASKEECASSIQRAADLRPPEEKEGEERKRYCHPERSCDEQRESLRSRGTVRHLGIFHPLTQPNHAQNNAIYLSIPAFRCCQTRNPSPRVL